MSGPLAWRAIGLGVAVSIAASLVIAVLGGMLGPMIDAVGVAVVSWTIRLFGLGADAAAGFVAGRLAGRDGALHGLIAGAIGASAGLAVSLPSALSAGFQPNAAWWLQVVGWTLAGVALAFLGGALGAQSRRPRRP